MNNSFDIVAFINNNPISRLPSGTTSLLVNKIKDSFTPEEQQLYIANFYAYLNYNDTDFVVPLNNVWKWLGFSRIEECKRVLTKNFKENIDYKIYRNETNVFAPPTCGAKNDEINKDKTNVFAPQVGGAKNDKNNNEINGINSTEVFLQSQENSISNNKDKTNTFAPQVGGAASETRGGHNKEYIYMTVCCFKKLCLKAKTSKADEIHDYYIKMERVVNESICEQAEEFSKQLQIKEKETQELYKDFKDIKEKSLMEAYDKKPVIYLAQIEEKVIKFGYSNDIIERVYKHREKDTWPNFKLIHVFETIYNRELETMIRTELKDYVITKIYFDKSHRELIQLCTSFDLDDLINSVESFQNKISNEKNVGKLMFENKIYLEKINDLTDANKQLVEANNFLSGTNKQLIEVNKLQKNAIESMEDNQLSIKIEIGEYIYIGNLQSNKNVHKIGILEICDESLIKPFSFIYYQKSKNAGKIKLILEMMLQSCIYGNEKNIYTIDYISIKKIFDYCVSIYDTYLIHESVPNTLNFIGRYGMNNLIKSVKENDYVHNDIYKEFCDSTIIQSTNSKLPLIFLCEEFYNWCVIKQNHMHENLKTTKNFTTTFTKQFCAYIEKYTGIMSDIIYIPKYSGYKGFIGITTKLFEEHIGNNYYDKKIYEEYIDEYLVVTNNDKHKVTREELLEDFAIYVKKKGIYNEKTYCKTYSLKFIYEFMRIIENKTGILYEAMKNKREKRGCFVGLYHKEFKDECIVNASKVKVKPRKSKKE
jgi:hypothetical protein